MFKKYTSLLSLLLLGGVCIVQAAWQDNVLPVTQLSAKPDSCSMTQLYANEDNDSDGIQDVWIYPITNIKANGTIKYGFEAWQILSTSTVGYYRPLNNMIYKLYNGTVGALDNSTFYRASRVFPYNTPVRSVAADPNKVVFERPSDNNATNNEVVLQYNYQYKYATGLIDGTSAYRYNQITGINDYNAPTYITTLPGSYGNKKRLWSTVQTTSSCKGFRINWCGDGKINTTSTLSTLNTFTSEVCDSGVNNSNTITGACNLGCTGFVTGGAGDDVCSSNTTVIGSSIECDNGVENNGKDEKCTINCTIEVTIIPDLIRDEL